MAIALGRSIPDSGTDRLPGQASHARLASRRKRNFSPSASLTGAHFVVNGVTNSSRTAARSARTESAALPGNDSKSPVTGADLKPRLVQKSFEHIISAGPSAMEYFYTRLFTTSPRTRALFPLSMTAQRERIFAALARLIWSLDDQPRR